MYFINVIHTFVDFMRT